MTEEWAKLLPQLPIVLMFIWYSLEMNKRSDATYTAFMDALQKRDEAFDKRNTAVIEAINNLNAAVCAELESIRRGEEAHDAWSKENATEVATQLATVNLAASTAARKAAR